MVMDSPQDPLLDVLRVLVADGEEPAPEDHPSPEELIAYGERGLPPPEVIQIQSHLAACRECAQTILDLESFPAVELRDEILRRSDEEEAADWLALRRLLGMPNSPTMTAPAQSGVAAGSQRLHRRRIVELAAAALLAVAVGLGWWAAGLRRQVATLSRELSAPQANVFVSDLVPGSRLRSTASVLQVPAETQQLVLILNLDDLRPFHDYEVEARDEKDMVFWQQRGLRRGPEGNFSVALPRSAIPSDPCQIRLFGRERSHRTLLATYLVKVDFAAPG
jgi:anti-sigma factor RsiW